jgi:hypothetical protein
VGPFEVGRVVVQFLGARLHERVFSSYENNAIGVDVFLELWLHQFSHCLLVDLIFNSWDLLALFVYGWRFFLWGFWLDDENLLGRYIAERIAI